MYSVRFFGLSQLGFDFFDCRQRSFEPRRQLLEELELCNAERLRQIPDRIFSDDLILGFAQNQPDGRLIVLVSEQVIDSREIEVHLAGVFGLECGHLQVNHHKAPPLQVIEQEVEPKVLSGDLQRHLAPDKRKANSKFDKELLQVDEQLTLEIALLRRFREREEVEIVRVFDELLGQIGLRSGEGLLEVGDRLSLPVIQLTLDLHDEHVPAPAIQHRLLGIPEPLIPAFHFLD